MADMTKMQARIRELEARREKGESVPELDALYKRMDALTEKGYAEATKSLSGEMPDFKPLPGKPSAKKFGEEAKPLPGKSKTQKLGEGMQNYKRGGKVKPASARTRRYAEGGEIAAQQPTYPFYGNQPAASTTQPSEPVTQTFNIQPGMAPGDMGFKKGGKVKSASQRADGCAIRGKTRA